MYPSPKHSMSKETKKSGGWNYRFIRSKEGEDYIFNVCEVYYDLENRAISWTDPIHAQGDTPMDLANDLSLMFSAFQRPILEVSKPGKLVEIEVNRVTGKNK